MSRHGVFAQFFCETVRGAFRKLARVYENERGAMLIHQLRHALVHFIPQLMRRNGSKLAVRNLHRQIQRFSVTDVDHDGLRPPLPRKESSYFFNRLLRGRQPDPHRPIQGKMIKPLQGKRKVRASLVIRNGVNLIHDDGFNML